MDQHEYGASAVRRLLLPSGDDTTILSAIAVLDAVKAAGQVPEERFGEVCARISFFVNAGVRFVEEMCKMRAFGRLWDTLLQERYGVTDAKQRRFRYGVQVNSLGLTEAQPENNVQRIVLEMLGVTLSKDARARAVQLPAWNEALGLPRPWDQQWSLRLQQVLAFESDLLEYDDIFEGSTVIDGSDPSRSSVDIAINKAFTARAFDLPTADLGADSQPGGPFYGIQESNRGRVVILAGGIPLERDGEVVGAVGVSGGDGEQDTTVAEAAAAAF